MSFGRIFEIKGAAMQKMVRLVFLFFVLFLVSGCNQDGVGPFSSSGGGSGDIVLAGLSGSSGLDSFSSPEGDVFGSGDGQQIVPQDGSGINEVVNPEPASMLLWGIGLAGAAIWKRKRNIKA